MKVEEKEKEEEEEEKQQFPSDRCGFRECTQEGTNEEGRNKGEWE